MKQKLGDQCPLLFFFSLSNFKTRQNIGVGKYQSP